MIGTKVPCVVQTHDTTWHDGGVAILLPNGEIYALPSERVADRVKHTGDSRKAYEYMRARFAEHQDCFGTATDFSGGVAKQDFHMAPHHRYHAASAFYGSPFKDAAILVIDGQGPENGQWVATTLWEGDESGLHLLEMFFPSPHPFVPQSIGHFYTAIGALAGMQHLHEEGKTMGLASYGRPSRYMDCFRQYAYSHEDGSFHIDPCFIYAVFGNTFGPRYFRWEPQPFHIQRIWEEIVSLRSSPFRVPDGDVTQDDMDIAYAGQTILDEIVIGLARKAKETTGKRNLCMAGGVVLNCTTNAKVFASGLFEDIYIFPAPDDSGQALGKLFLYIHDHNLPVDTATTTSFFGPTYRAEEITAAFVGETKIAVVSNELEETLVRAASCIADGQVIGWFQGRSEIGPRALGHRSILADPRRREIRDYINARVKHREWYRPIAPVVLEEEASKFFHMDRPSPFMLFAFQVRADKLRLIPAAVHVDHSARVQTLNYGQEPRLYTLIEKFDRLTGIPILINTSFNGQEPIVETPNDAVRSFLQMKLDAFVLDKYLLTKKNG